MDIRIERFMGLSQSVDEMITPATHAVEAQNVSTESGRLTVASGYRSYGAAQLSGGIGTLAAFYQRSEGVLAKRLVAVNQERISTLSDGTWRTIYEGAGSERASHINYQQNGEDILLMGDGVRPVLKWDGGEQMVALSGCERKFGHLTLHYERVWGSGLQTEPDAVYWSRAFNPEDWTGDEDNPDAGGGVVLIPTWNGGSVKAIKTLFNDVLVFKDDDLYRIVGTYPGNYEVARVHGVVGPVAPMSIAWAADACYFLGRSGLCAYNGVTVSGVGGGEVKSVFERVNPLAANGAVSAIYRDKLFLALALDGAQSNNAVLEVDLKRGTYLIKTGLEARCFLPFDDELLMADGSGRVFVYGVGDTYAGQKIDAFWRAPWQTLNGKRGRFAELAMFASGTMDIVLETDESRVMRRVRLGERMRPVRVPLGGRGRRYCLTIKNVDGGRFTVAPGLTVSVEEDD